MTAYLMPVKGTPEELVNAYGGYTTINGKHYAVREFSFLNVEDRMTDVYVDKPVSYNVIAAYDLAHDGSSTGHTYDTAEAAVRELKNAEWTKPCVGGYRDEYNDVVIESGIFIHLAPTSYPFVQANRIREALRQATVLLVGSNMEVWFVDEESLKEVAHV